MLVLVRNAALGAFSQCLVWECLRYMQQELGTELAEKVWRNIMARYMKVRGSKHCECSRSTRDQATAAIVP